MDHDELRGMFDALGKPEGVGRGFGITASMAKGLGLTDETIPAASYDHGVWFDSMTDNYIVIRPGADGVYGDFPTHHMRRIR